MFSHLEVRFGSFRAFEVFEDVPGEAVRVALDGFPQRVGIQAWDGPEGLGFGGIRGWRDLFGAEYSYGVSV